MAKSLRKALRDYCNLDSDLKDLAEAKKTVIPEDKAHIATLRQRLEKHMVEHKVDCFFDPGTQKFVYRSKRTTTKPLTEELQDTIIQVLEQKQQNGELNAIVDMEQFIKVIVDNIQLLRAKHTSFIAMSDKKPSSIKTVVTPAITKIQELVHDYITHSEKLKELETQINAARKEINVKLEEAKPIVEIYCRDNSIIKKPMNFKRQWSTEFSSCITKLNPHYFTKVKKHTARRYLQYKQSKSRNRKVTSLRPNKGHIVELLTSFTQQRTNWTHVNIVKELFRVLQEEAEEKIAKKLEENESSPNYKLSLGAELGYGDE